MTKRMLIDDTQPEETRVVIVDGNKVEDVEFESTSRKQIKGNIYTAKVIRIEPSLQAAFIDYGGNKHGFLAFNEIHPDYYNVSEDVLNEVNAEVDEIINEKIKYLKEKEAERARYKAEKEAQEAQRRLEAEQAREVEEAQLEPVQNTIPEDDSYLQSDAAETCESNSCEQAETVQEVANEEVASESENVVADDEKAETVQEVANEEVASESENVVAVEEKAETVQEVASEEVANESENVVAVEEKAETVQEVASEEVASESENVTADEEKAETVQEVASEEVASESENVTADEEKAETVQEVTSEEVASESENAVADEEKDVKKRRRYTRRPRNKKSSPKTMAEAIGTADESIEEDCDVDNDEDDDDVETEGNEYNFDLQRKLLRARKLFHRSTIQDVIKEGQTLLIQVVKEERGNKGAACTTYISLAGRYCVLMPNRIKSGGVSRKITNANDRKRLKGIIKELPINPEMSLIVRTAGEEKSKTDIVRDYNYLIRTWNAIRYSALKNQAPAIIYEEGNLIKRALRDMYTKDIAEVIIDGDEAYQTARNFVKILSPHNLKNIKCRRSGEAPVFQRFQVEAQLDKLHNPIVQLESGGYLVINPTEALVSIDVNSGRATKEKDIEETALKTNLEAADEIAKQLKMRDLAGLVVVDFIDMYEPQNNVAIERRMKEAMKDDRARIQIAKMSIFGLLEISRQRMHSSFMESNYEVCPYCHGHGVMRTIESGATLVLRAIEGEGVRNRDVKLTVSVPADTAAYLLNQKRKQLSELEDLYHISIVVAGVTSMKDVADFKIEREKIVVPVVRCKDAATTCYEEDNIEQCDDETADSCEELSCKNENSRQRQRSGRNRRFRRSDKREADREDRKNEQPIMEEAKPVKKSWWRKLIG